MHSSPRLPFLPFFFCALLFSPSAKSQDTLRVMYYNLLNFPNEGAPNRQDTMERIFQHVQPDVLLVCELQSLAGANALLGTLNGLGIGTYARATYVSNQSSSNNLQNMCFYRSDKIGLYSQDEVLTGLRDINEYRLFRVDGATSDTVFLDFYVAHLKSASGSANEAEREAAVLSFKAHLNSLPASDYRIFGGDLNLYNSTEPAYQALLNTAPVLFDDPINRPGNWSNNGAFDDIHTQSTRVTAFGGGATGGLDDRFDHIMVSENISSGTGDVRYLSGSYKAIGNDGNHFNQAVNSGINNSAPPEVISALFQSSDHLPVVLDLLVFADPITPPVDTGSCGDLFFSEYIEGTSNNKALEIYNPTEETIDLSAYVISLYNNGASTPNSSLTLSGMLAPGETYQVVNASATAALLSLADATSGVTFYNGDDALGLFRSGELIDAIGEIGVDPGTNWTVGSGATSEYTLVRKPTVRSGQIDWNIGATEWLVYPQDEFSFYGGHTADPCPDAVTCSTSEAPTGLSHTLLPGGVRLNWDELSGALKCEVNGRPLGAPSFAKIRVNVPPYEAFVPAAQLNPGTTYEWKLRCACSLSPLEVTPFSPLQTFTWPVLRADMALDNTQEFLVFPNPASTYVTISLPVECLNSTWEVFDRFGQLVAVGESASQSLTLEVNDWPSGIYFLKSSAFPGRIIGRIGVSH